MKFRNSPFLLALALVVSSPLMSHASDCSNSTIRGSYAFTIHGSIVLPDGSTLLVDASPSKRLMVRETSRKLTQLPLAATSHRVGALARAPTP